VQVGGRLLPACTGMREGGESGGRVSVLQLAVVAKERRKQRLRRRRLRRRRWRRRRSRRRRLGLVTIQKRNQRL